MTPERRLRVVVAGLPRIFLNDFCVHGAVEVQVHPENIAGLVVSRTDGVQDDISAVFLVVPVHDIVLPVAAQIKRANRHAVEKASLPVSDEIQALAIEEVGLAVKRLGVDVGHLADAPHGRFVHQEGEDGPVLVRGLVTGGGFADSEGLLQALQR
jgi:hypothetical protein